MPKEKNSMSGFYTAIAEQFTILVRFNSTIVRLPIPPGSALDSSVTQFVIGL